MTGEFGKLVFIVCDLITGLLIMEILKNAMNVRKNVVLMGSVWLLNPMVITISTRGSSESVLTVFVMGFVYLLVTKKAVWAGVVLGLAVHLKIYPVIYLPTAMLYLSAYNSPCQLLCNPLVLFHSAKPFKFLLAALLSFACLTATMYQLYGSEFLQHTYLYHLTRTDHRHNFSLYNISLYFTSNPQFSQSLDLTKFAFFPQLVISGLLIPLVFTKKSLSHTLLLQTLCFVAFNKVMTSQYFIWFLIFIPLVLPRSNLMSIKGGVMLLLWILGQAAWLYHAFQLEFLGLSTFYPQILWSSIGFFVSNLALLGAFMDSADHAAGEYVDGL